MIYVSIVVTSGISLVKKNGLSNFLFVYEWTRWCKKLKKGSVSVCVCMCVFSRQGRSYRVTARTGYSSLLQPLQWKLVRQRHDHFHWKCPPWPLSVSPECHPSCNFWISTLQWNLVSFEFTKVFRWSWALTSEWGVIFCITVSESQWVNWFGDKIYNGVKLQYKHDRF